MTFVHGRHLRVELFVVFCGQSRTPSHSCTLLESVLCSAFLMSDEGLNLEHLVAYDQGRKGGICIVLFSSASFKSVGCQRQEQQTLSEFRPKQDVQSPFSPDASLKRLRNVRFDLVSSTAHST